MDGKGGADGGGRELLVRIQAVESLSEISAVIDLLLGRFRFDYYKLFAARSVPTGSLRDHLLLTNVAPAFIDGFDAIGGLPAAPVRIFATTDRLVYQWHVSDLSVKAQASPQVGQLMALLKEHGMSQGAYAALPTLDGRKHIFGVYGERDALTQVELDEFSFLSIHLLDRLETLEKRRAGQQTGISGLEIECLLMTAAGHDTAAIARRLSLSMRTVNYLVGSLCRKLGTDRLEHALAEAARLGYLD